MLIVVFISNEISFLNVSLDENIKCLARSWEYAMWTDTTIIKRLCGPGFVVSEEDCLRAMAAAFHRLRIVIEPGGAVALAAALYHPETITGDAVIAVASGGNVDADMFQRAIANYGDGSVAP